MLSAASAGCRPRRMLTWLLMAMLIGAACSTSAEDTAISAAPPLPPSTTLADATVPEPTEAPADTQSSTSATDVAAPSYLVYGWEGVTRVHPEGPEFLLAEPVRWAADDGAGGIVFESVAAQPGQAWLPAGADRPTDIPNGFFFLLDGQPTALVSRSSENMTRCENQEFMEELSIRDLTTGAEEFLMCREFSSDAWREITSFGGGLFLSLGRWQLIGSGTSVLRFYDLAGQEITVKHNPFEESCHPCRMSARLSSDGALLAYSLWPTAFSEPPEPFDGDYTRAYREWREQQQDIPTQVVVVDMATGVEVFRTDVVADAELTGFDGRIATVATRTGRELFDIESGESFTAPPALTGPSPFWTVMLASLDNTTTDYDAAQHIAAELAAQHAVETGVLWSDGLVSLNPGYWAVFTGHFLTQDEAVAYCEALDTDCYPRYVATAAVDGPSYYRFGDDGLYRVAHGSETQLDAHPVTWAADDLMGGVIYRWRSQLDPETTDWLRADGSTDNLLHDLRFVAHIEGEPTAVVIVPDVNYADEAADMLLVGLRSGYERRVPDIGFVLEAWSYPQSYGEGLFVGVDGVAAGCGYSDRVISFWDGDGNRIQHPHNPVAEPCHPCELSAAISPDGRLLAYSHRADAPSDSDGRLMCGQRDEWWSETQEILADVVVMDLDTGHEVFRVTAPARTFVIDFDGRFVAVEQGDWVDAKTVTIYDTWGLREPVQVDGGVALMRQEPTTPARSELVLRPDGLGTASFGDPAELVVETVISLLGSPDRDIFIDPVAEQTAMPYGYGANRFFRLVEWDQVGLYLVLSDGNYYRGDGVPHFVGWGVTRSGLETEEGIGVGSRVADLVVAYGDRVTLPDSFLSECDGGWTFRVEPADPLDASDYYASMHGELDEDPRDVLSRVTRLHGGATATC